jgi:hypothetical protein
MSDKEVRKTEIERVNAEADSKIEELQAKLRAAKEETPRKAEEIEVARAESRRIDEQTKAA